MAGVADPLKAAHVLQTVSVRDVPSAILRTAHNALGSRPWELSAKRYFYVDAGDFWVISNHENGHVALDGSGVLATGHRAQDLSEFVANVRKG